MLKSCRSKIATLVHDVSDVHGTSSLYIKAYWQSYFIYVFVLYIYMHIYIYIYRVFPTGGDAGSPLHCKKFVYSYYFLAQSRESP